MGILRNCQYLTALNLQNDTVVLVQLPLWQRVIGLQNGADVKVGGQWSLLRDGGDGGGADDVIPCSFCTL